MFTNYLKVAFRNLNKNRAYAAINILGLALGLMVAIIVFLFVKAETGYEKHIADYDRIYRVGIQANMMGQAMDAPVSPSPAALTLRTEFPEVENATRINPVRQEIMIQHEENKIYIEKGAHVDSAFFEVFSYEFVHGDPSTAMDHEHSMVITEETAQKFFGDENPMGKILNYDTRQDYLITGVVKEPKGNSHFRFDMFTSGNHVENVWISNNFQTYFILKEGYDANEFKVKMEAKFLEYIAPDVEKYLQTTIEDFLASDNEFSYDIQAIQKIHLHSQRDWEIEQNGSIMYVLVFIVIAFLVILIAGINFMNLSTARSAKRAKEVGIRKVSGATKGMLIGQFLLESVIQSVIALFLAFTMAELFLPAFNNVMESNLQLFNDHFTSTLIFGLLITIGYGVFSGSYPAFFLSSFQPISVLKGDVSKSRSGSLFRKSLVVVQFAASTVLIIGMIIIFNQISFIHNKNLGFNGDQVIVVPLQTDKVTQNFRTYKGIFTENPNVISVSRSSYLPGGTPNQNVYALEGTEDQLPFWNMEVDYDFLETLSIEVAEGRGFSRELDHDSSNTFIVNQTAVNNFNIENPIGRRIGNYGRDGGVHFGTIVGVVKDFHIEGFNAPIKPMVLAINNSTWFASMKIAPENMDETISYIETKWNEMEPSHPFTYSYLDETFGALFKQQENFGKMFLYLTILAIIISCMGLYGLASYTAEQRTKEIGVRKVMGASVPQLMRMLSKDFIKLVLIANLFAWPIALVLARNWLSGFTYQISMPIMPFILATLGAIIIALMTVSYQAYQAAVSDPVKALKYE